jgi:TRAP-type mannitol/chloroaromatic compound transport system permease large subunit
MSPELLGAVMMAALITGICAGFPIAFTLLVITVVFGYIGLGPLVFDLIALQTIGLAKEEVLAAVPLFIFMGYMTEQAGLMERLFLAFQLALAPIRGSLCTPRSPPGCGTASSRRLGRSRTTYP